MILTKLCGSFPKKKRGDNKAFTEFTENFFAQSQFAEFTVNDGAICRLN